MIQGTIKKPAKPGDHSRSNVSGFFIYHSFQFSFSFSKIRRSFESFNFLITVGAVKRTKGNSNTNELDYTLNANINEVSRTGRITAPLHGSERYKG